MFKMSFLNISPFKRYPGNPILKKGDIPYPVNTVFNAAACKYNNMIYLLLRIEDKKGISHLTLARSDNGFDFKVDPYPFLTPADYEPFKTYEKFGIEDPRITYFEDGTYYILYTANSYYRPRIAIAKTCDFKKVERISLISEPINKNAVLFSEKIKRKFVRLDRPDDESIWISYSPDLIYWGESKILLSPRTGKWDCHKLGAAIPPIKTKKGWLVLYHGVRFTAAGRLYRVGGALLDLENPERVIGISDGFLFGPEELYERVGDVGNVVFPCGAILEENGEVKLYYGAADSCIAIATSNLSDLIDCCSFKCENGSRRI